MIRESIVHKRTLLTDGFCEFDAVPDAFLEVGLANKPYRSEFADDLVLRVDQNPRAHRIFVIVDIHGLLHLGLALRIENFAQRGQFNASRARGERVLLFQRARRDHGMIVVERRRVCQERPSVCIVHVEYLSNANAGRLQGLQLFLFDEQRA